MDSSGSGIRRVKPWRLMLAHDPVASTCAPLVGALATTFPQLELVDATSIEDARASLRMGSLDAALVCLDLPPAPMGAVRLARAALAENHAVVLVTRSLRWLPQDADDLRALPWVAPDATPEDLLRAMRALPSRSSSRPPATVAPVIDLDARRARARR
jgi:hypothetical protein